MLYWVILLLAVPVLARQQDLEKKAHFSQMRWQYYQMVEHQQKEVRKLKHDMRNHLTALSGLTGKERDQYLQDLLDAPALNTKVTFCENQTANILLASKMEQAQELQACLDIEADIPDLPGHRSYGSLLTSGKCPGQRSGSSGKAPDKAAPDLLSRPRTERAVCDRSTEFLCLLSQPGQY